MRWDSSTDNIPYPGVVGYDILREAKGYDGTLPFLEGGWTEPVRKVGSTDSNAFVFTDSGLESGCYYTYYVVAKDAAGNTNQSQASISKKKDAPDMSLVELRTITDGLSVQMTHIGPYDAEAASFALMDQFCASEGLVRIGHTHREIYMSDPRRTDPEKLKTVIRYFVKRGESNRC